MQPPITLAFMETCYQQCCFGNEEPTHIAMSMSRRDELLALLMNTPRYKEQMETIGKMIFNNAEIVCRERMGADVINFVNVFVLKPGMSGEFYITG